MYAFLKIEGYLDGWTYRMDTCCAKRVYQINMNKCFARYPGCPGTGNSVLHSCCDEASQKPSYDQCNRYLPSVHYQEMKDLFLWTLNGGMTEGLI